MKLGKFIAFMSVLALCPALTSCSGKNDEITVEEKPTASDEFITPKEDAEDYDLGEYQVAESGVKYYYDPETVPKDVMKALERYFTAYQQRDFETYKECLFPKYADNMEEYLQRDYEYGLEKSFESQCDNLVDMAGGEFQITRIKTVTSDNETPEQFFKTYDELFNTDYYADVKAEAEKFYDLYFYIMTEAGEEEKLIISDFEIVFAEKDGKFYTFG